MFYINKNSLYLACINVFKLFLNKADEYLRKQNRTHLFPKTLIQKFPKLLTIEKRSSGVKQEIEME